MFRKNPQIPENWAKKSRNPKKNRRDFLIPIESSSAFSE
jgi:hypothetical protein